MEPVGTCIYLIDGRLLRIENRKGGSTPCIGMARYVLKDGRQVYCLTGSALHLYW